jgi:hypothetical protein
MATKLGWKTREKWCGFAVESVSDGDRVAAFGLKVMKAEHQLDNAILELKREWWNGSGKAEDNGHDRNMATEEATTDSGNGRARPRRADEREVTVNTTEATND